MRLFAGLTITQKLTAITMLTTAMVIVLMATAITLNEAVAQKRSLYQKRSEQLAALAAIIGSRSTAALVFDDRATAQENLDALNVLQADTSLVFAAVYDAQGALFVEHRSAASDERLNQRARNSECGQENQLDLEILLMICQEIVLDSERIGDVRIAFDMSRDLEQLQSSLIRYLVLLLVLVALAFLLAFLLSSRLQRMVAAPILALREAMENVSQKQDYSVRVSKRSDDELGALVDGFNHMLEQVQVRDAELARYSGDLEAQIETRTAELAEANRRRLLWLENLAYFLRHELKNSTIGVRSSLDLIERRAKNDAIEKYLMRARASVSFMASLLESVGSVSTLETSFDKEEKTFLDLGALVSQQVDAYRSVYQDVALVADCEKGINVNGNSTRLIQLLDKLVANAVDHSAPGFPIVVTVQKAHGQARLMVADKGECLPEESERIFELFVSLRGADYRAHENLGLGLYVVKLIAEAHGGTVSAENLPDKDGALFTVSLPLA